MVLSIDIHRPAFTDYRNRWMRGEFALLLRDRLMPGRKIDFGVDQGGS
jgi:hypothetical protein